ncbi:MAG TPA: hypothetical protein ENH29_06295 [Bacteroidetes bacterium]|nr:hypothetical protein [Bacteroidota bacterium]
MVMKKMREHTKTFLVILVLAFVGTIIFDWGMNVTGIKKRPNVAGEVNGEEIKWDQFNRRYQQLVENKREQGQDNLSDNDMMQIENQVWDEIVQEILIRQEIHRRGIVATDSEIVMILKNNPPKILRDVQSFQTDGKFDMQKYRAALTDQNPQNQSFWLQAEDYVRNFMLPYQKLQEQIAASVFVTPEEVRWNYIKQNEKIKVQYIFFDPNNISDDEVNVDNSEIEKYYRDHEKKYHEPEKRKIDYVMFPFVPTANDSQAVFSDAKDLMKRIKNGEDFAKLAKSYSEDPGSAQKGGELGFFGKGTMVKQFDDAAFSAKVGTVVGPIKSSFGIHIIEVEEKKVENGEEKVRARHILLKFTTSSQTESDMKTKASLFAMDAMEMGFSEAASRDSLKIETSPFFIEGGFIPGIGFSRTINQFVHKSKIGDIREEPFYTDRGYVVAKINDIQPERTKPLADVSASIKSMLIREKKIEEIGKYCAGVRSKMLVTADFQTIAEKDSLKITETNQFSRNDYIPQVGKDPDFTGTAFGLNVNKISHPVKTARGYYLIKVIEKVPIDEANFEAQKNTLRQTILSRKQQQAFIDWFNDLKAKARIKDLRQNA